MVKIVPTSEEARNLEGLHLYHSARSNCSARVRLLLEEKQIEWTSHHIELFKKENLCEAYFAINPKGLVPALVHDGTSIIESNDILVYLEEVYPEPSFRAVSEQDQAQVATWLRKSGDLHIPAIKTFMYYKMNASRVKKSAEEEELYRKLQKDPELLAFHSKHSGGKSFTDEDAAAAIGLLNDVFGEINQALEGKEWLVGDTYTLADISWAPTITTLQNGGFDFAAFPNVLRWYDVICKRPAFEKAVFEWRKGAN
eukprot:TRINITY_DN16992_c0_g2_i1.p1 TRINITY_DN16992_c0_g2~~TRINITY_DN16992_c0_g2_i1.p1  ORF type:complete len:255 (+),score=35.92 TRINITY_DN16992_c0_g2_i1:88-852(+)